MAEVAARDMARRIALPERPADPRAGEEWVSVTVKTRHESHTLTACIPAQRGVKRPRSDQFTVALDGEPVAGLEGYTAILARVGEWLPRMMTRKERAEVDSIRESEC